MPKQRLFPTLFFIIVVVVGAAVWLMGSERGNNPWTVDPQEVTLPAPGWRPPIALHDIVREMPGGAAGLEAYRTAAGRFGQTYVEEVLAIGAVEDPNTADELKAFARHETIAPSLAAIDTTAGKPTVLNQTAATLEAAFRRFHHHFPTAPVPQLVWMHSGFNYAVFPTEEVLAIGLEWFLGPDHEIVNALAPSVFPAYMKARMRPEWLAPDAARGWLLVHFSKTHYQAEQCADALLFWGKVLFILDQILPQTPNPDWMDWTPEEWAWATGHEREIWLELSKQEELFNTNAVAYMRWFNEGPFTRAANVPQESPDRLGAWLGWRIVSDYMAAHPERSLQELMDMTDPMPFLKSYR